jgi:hypothetical protein
VTIFAGSLKCHPKYLQVTLFMVWCQPIQPKPAYRLNTFHTGWSRPRFGPANQCTSSPVHGLVATNPTRETSLSKLALQFQYGLARLRFGPASPSSRAKLRRSSATGNPQKENEPPAPAAATAVVDCASSMSYGEAGQIAMAPPPTGATLNALFLPATVQNQCHWEPPPAVSPQARAGSNRPV